MWGPEGSFPLPQVSQEWDWGVKKERKTGKGERGKGEQKRRKEERRRRRKGGMKKKRKKGNRKERERRKQKRG